MKSHLMKKLADCQEFVEGNVICAVSLYRSLLMFSQFKTIATRAERDLEMATWLEEHGVELVVLAGYMHLLTPPFLRRFSNKATRRGDL